MTANHNKRNKCYQALSRPGHLLFYPKIKRHFIVLVIMIDDIWDTLEKLSPYLWDLQM